MRLTQAYRSLPRSSSAPKPRYPPNSGGVLASTQGKIQIACTKASIFGDDKKFLYINYETILLKFNSIKREYVPMNTNFMCLVRNS
jgi:hypothetical protein